MKITKQVLNQVEILSASAFGMMAALAWNDAVRSMMDKYYPIRGEGVSTKVVYASSVTVLAVLASVGIAKGLDVLGGEEE